MSHFCQVIEQRLLASPNTKQQELAAVSNKISRSWVAPEHAVVIFSSFGVGDHLNLIGAVRYLSMREDLIFIPCIRRTISRVIDMYRDDHRIIPVEIEQPQMAEILYGKPCTDFFDIPCAYDILRTGGNFVPDVLPTYPYNQYTPLFLPINILRDYFYLPPETEATPAIPTNPDGTAIQTALVHTSVSHGADLFTLEEAEIRAGFDRNDVFVVHVGENAYSPDHPWYAAAKSWGQLSFLRYAEFMQNAKYIAVTDSCFFCMAMLTNPPTPHCYRADRPGTDWDNMYSYANEQVSVHGQGVPKWFRSIHGPPAAYDE